MLPAKQEKSDILYFCAWQHGGTSTVSITWGYEGYKHAGKNWKDEANVTQECSSLTILIHFMSVSLQFFYIRLFVRSVALFCCASLTSVLP
jgi:hypothetical protein